MIFIVLEKLIGYNNLLFMIRNILQLHKIIKYFSEVRVEKDINVYIKETINK